MAEADAQYPLEFLSGGAPDAGLEVRHLRGREELSRLYHFDLILKRKAGTLTRSEIDAILRAPCALSLGFGQNDIVHGIVERLTLLDSMSSSAAIYRLRVVPGMWLLTQSRTNRVFQNMTVAQIVEHILKLYGFVEGKHFSVMIEGGVEHEYVVQYEESDWDFIQRWLEFEGYFYWFEHHKNGEKLVVADNNDDATPIADPHAISYRDRNNLATDGESTIWDWTIDQKRILARVAVVDHNYRMPHVPLIASAETDTQSGFGSIMIYGEHFKDVERGKAIAKLRAERILCSQRTFRGKTDCGRFNVGHSFTLSGHFDAPGDESYLITSIDHNGGVGDEGVFSPDGQHSAHFECIPIDVPFRPARITPWPRISGVMHAHIDADGAGEHAQIDDNGRYKVRMPFDSVGDNKGSAASRWIRMAQPYSGAGYGSHFPLHKGAEVLIAHVDGNPDRPIIIGAIPCAHTPSPSTSANATQSVIQTASGIRLEMEDQA